MKIKQYSANPEVQKAIEVAMKIKELENQNHLLKDAVREKVNASRKSNKPESLKISEKK
jgi:predicted phage gp36 major capsid-like protein